MLDPAMRVGTEVSREAAADIIKSISIPACPAVVLALLEEARKPEVDFHNLVRLISGDVSLAASMLKAANSPLFGLKRKVQTVQQAISVLGLKNILNIIMGLALRDSLAGKDVPSMNRYWERSHLIAVVSSQLARRLPNVSTDNAYTFGLFRDCGIPILMQKFPDYKDLLAQANASASHVADLENRTYQTSHVVVGAMLARNWYLPQAIVGAIRYHHEFNALDEPGEDISSEVCDLISISFVAEHLVTKFLGYKDDADWQLESARVMKFLGIDEDDLSEFLDDAQEDLAELSAYRR